MTLVLDLFRFGLKLTLRLDLALGASEVTELIDSRRWARAEGARECAAAICACPSEWIFNEVTRRTFQTQTYTMHLLALFLATRRLNEEGAFADWTAQSVKYTYIESVDLIFFLYFFLINYLYFVHHAEHPRKLPTSAISSSFGTSLKESARRADEKKASVYLSLSSFTIHSLSAWASRRCLL